VSTRIHPGAFVDPAARLGADVVVGPGAVIGPHVTIGDRTRVLRVGTVERRDHHVRVEHADHRRQSPRSSSR